MPEPIVFIMRNRVRAGMLEEFKRHYLNSLPATLADKPGTLTQLAFEDEGTGEVAIVRFFPDADALDRQIQGADQRSKKTYEFIEPVSIEIFGTLKPTTLEKMMKIAGSGVSVKISPRYLGGFIR